MHRLGSCARPTAVLRSPRDSSPGRWGRWLARSVHEGPDESFPWLTRVLPLLAAWLKRRVGSEDARTDLLLRQTIVRLAVLHNIDSNDEDCERTARLAAEGVVLEHQPRSGQPPGQASDVLKLNMTQAVLLERALADQVWALSLARRLELALSPERLRLFWALYVERLDAEDTAQALKWDLDRLRSEHQALAAEVRRLAWQAYEGSAS